jgi:hypothetical protein
VCGDALAAEAVEQIEGILHRAHHRFIPRKCNLREMNVVLKVKLIDQSFTPPANN